MGFDYRDCIRKLNDLNEDIKKEKKRSFDMLIEKIHFDRESEEEVTSEEIEDTDGVSADAYFSDIRKICLKGISDLSETPNSSEYETLKKIWDMCDKFYSNKSKR